MGEARTDVMNVPSQGTRTDVVMGPAGPAVNPDPLDAPASKPEEFKCPECGKEYNGPAWLGRHRSAAHGVRGQSKAQKNRRKQGKKTRRKRAQITAEPHSVVAVFAAMAESISERGALDKEIIEGMTVLAKAVTGLRKLTLKTRSDLHRLRKDWMLQTDEN